MAPATGSAWLIRHVLVSDAGWRVSASRPSNTSADERAGRIAVDITGRDVLEPGGAAIAAATVLAAGSRLDRGARPMVVSLDT